MKMSGASMIDQERNRQIYEENWSAEHDDSHRLAEMTLAALSYASLAASQMRNPRYSCGIKVQALITRIAAKTGQDLSQFERELQETRPPSADFQAFPLRMIL